MIPDVVQKLRQIFSLEVVLLLLWIPGVILVFSLIADRKIAGVVAGSVFLTLPLFNIYREKNKTAQDITRLTRVGLSAIFFLLSAMPIFLLRVFNWDKSLDEISVAGVITGRELHSFSNILYMLLIAGYLVANYIDTKNKNGAV